MASKEFLERTMVRNEAYKLKPGVWLEGVRENPQPATNTSLTRALPCIRSHAIQAFAPRNAVAS